MRNLGGNGGSGWDATRPTPKLRRGSYFPRFLKPRRTAEGALVTMGKEA
jgi:hypothetical protein